MHYITTSANISKMIEQNSVRKYIVGDIKNMCEVPLMTPHAGNSQFVKIFEFLSCNILT